MPSNATERSLPIGLQATDLGVGTVEPAGASEIALVSYLEVPTTHVPNTYVAFVSGPVEPTGFQWRAEYVGGPQLALEARDGICTVTPDRTGNLRLSVAIDIGGATYNASLNQMVSYPMQAAMASFIAVGAVSGPLDDAQLSFDALRAEVGIAAMRTGVRLEWLLTLILASCALRRRAGSPHPLRHDRASKVYSRANLQSPQASNTTDLGIVRMPSAQVALHANLGGSPSPVDLVNLLRFPRPNLTIAANGLATLVGEVWDPTDAELATAFAMLLGRANDQQLLLSLVSTSRHAVRHTMLDDRTLPDEVRPLFSILEESVKGAPRPRTQADRTVLIVEAPPLDELDVIMAAVAAAGGGGSQNPITAAKALLGMQAHAVIGLTIKLRNMTAWNVIVNTTIKKIVASLLEESPMTGALEQLLDVLPNPCSGGTPVDGINGMSTRPDITALRRSAAPPIVLYEIKPDTQSAVRPAAAQLQRYQGRLETMFAVCHGGMVLPTTPGGPATLESVDNPRPVVVLGTAFTWEYARRPQFPSVPLEDHGIIAYNMSDIPPEVLEKAAQWLQKKAAEIQKRIESLLDFPPQGQLAPAISRDAAEFFALLLLIMLLSPLIVTLTPELGVAYLFFLLMGVQFQALHEQTSGADLSA